MPIRLLAMDLDGTLMNADHITVSQRNLDAVRSTAERGIQVALVSGRPRCLMENVAKMLGCVRYLISANGAVTADLQTGKTLFSHLIPRRQALKVLALFERYPLPTEVYCGGRIYVKKGSWNMSGYEKHPRCFLRMRAEKNIEVDSLEQVLACNDAEKFNVDGIGPGARDDILAGISPMRDLTHTYVTVYDNLEINCCLATKGRALRQLCGVVGITDREVMAFGDSSNDVSMLRWARWSFAMANSSKEALQAAHYRTGSNVDSGVAMTLERQILLQD